ncbi:MAG: ATP-binding cassette domain-containing protein [Bacteroidia bacterium]|nr:ABC-F family ATP-binding cassette domain-containing protein [Bacteroidia bacterium]MCO5252814.1 ATP-binding cassette domain-containing protein [Bacteroidota bacterium]MCZ2131431.1 ATP-binding cassette domain-containing protein [Bacteroidia bacterium]
MQLVVDKITKSYQGKILFRDKSFSLNLGDKVAIIGKNGSGKTTLIKILMGYTKPDLGEVYWLSDKGEKLTIDYKDFALAGIQQQLFDDLTVADAIYYHFKFREPIHDQYYEVLNNVFSQNLFSKKINQLSAGWLNRLKLLLAILTKSQVLILDEPFSNMDTEGIELTSKIILDNLSERTLVVAGNREDELALCDSRIQLT